MNVNTSKKHTSLSLLISCIDYRFWPHMLPMIKKKFGPFDLFDSAGASKNISSPKHKDEKHVAMENIETSMQLHHISTVILSNHIDCGAYGVSARFKNK